jgi:adrenodoxin-NADP+ reductase
MLLRHARRAFSSTQSPRVAIVGSGPGGFYTAKYLLRDSKDVQVTILDRWPTPFGLVRYGVAPDHPEVKSVQDDFEDVATSERFSYAGHVFVGHPADAPDHAGPIIPLNDLMSLYDAVVVATGCDLPRKLDLPGAELAGVVNARAFVGWYNAEPTFSGLDLPEVTDQLRSVIIGHGNVALDCARVLAAPSMHLDATDIHEEAFEALQRLPSKRLIHVVGRRGATQAAFTTKECRELTELEGAALVIDPAELEAGDTEASLKEGNARPLKRKRKFLDQVAASTNTAEREVHLRFLRRPVAFEEGAKGRVGAVVFEKCVLEGDVNAQTAVGTGELERIECDLAICAVGYTASPPCPDGGRAIPQAGPAGTYAQVGSRVAPGLYCSGWVKRGPTGIVGSNVADARETAAAVLEDLAASGVAGYGEGTSWADWRRIDTVEKANAKTGAPRAKFADVEGMLDAASSA